MIRQYVCLKHFLIKKIYDGMHAGTLYVDLKLHIVDLKAVVARVQGGPENSGALCKI